MFQEEKCFNLRFSLEADFPDEYDGEADNYGWLREWETALKPELLKAIFSVLRRDPSWNVHVRNRGVSPEDEIEITMAKDFRREGISKPSVYPSTLRLSSGQACSG